MLGHLNVWKRDFKTISGFPNEGGEISTLLRCYAVYSGNPLPTFRGKLSGPIFKDQEIKGDGTDMLYGNVGKELPL
jgi:hypothetical protein